MHSLVMAGSLIPALLDQIVIQEIVPRLPWHTRPILRTLSRTWKNELDSIDEYIGQLTRSAQPLQCLVAVEYRRREGNWIQILDREWRNAPCNRSDPPYVGIVSVIDGTLYSVRSTPDESRISALDVGSGLWQWKTVFIQASRPGRYIMSICRRLDGTRGYFVYYDGGSNDEIVHVNSEGQVEQVTAVRLPAVQGIGLFRIDPTIGFQQIENRLYVFGTYDSREIGVCFYDLSTSTWNMDEVYTVQRWLHRFGPNPSTDLNLTRNVLCVACIAEHVYIVRYSSSTRSWVIVGSTYGPSAMPGAMMSSSWSVECDSVGEKHVCIYAIPYDGRHDRYLLHKWLLHELTGDGVIVPSNVLNEDVLPQEPRRFLMVVDRPPTFLTSFGMRYMAECFGFAM